MVMYKQEIPESAGTSYGKVPGDTLHGMHSSWLNRKDRYVVLLSSKGYINPPLADNCLLCSYIAVTLDRKLAYLCALPIVVLALLLCHYECLPHFLVQ